MSSSENATKKDGQQVHADSGCSSAAAPAQEEFNQKLDDQVAAMQALLQGLAQKADAAEREANDELNGAATDSPADSRRRQGTVADAYKDMVQAEHAMGSFESRLDVLLSRLDSLIETQQEKSAEEKQ